MMGIGNWNRKAKVLSIWGIIFLISFVVTDYAFVVSHENAHKTIYKYNGIEAETDVWFTGLSFSGKTSVIKSEKSSSVEVVSQHANVEAIGYQLRSAYQGLGLFIFIFGILIIEIFVGRKNKGDVA